MGGYANCIPSWLLDEIVAKQAGERKRWKDMNLKLTARIITGAAEYTKELRLEQMRRPIYKLCCETMAQLESEQFIAQEGFRRVDVRTS
jgi:hypothetical protein